MLIVAYVILSGFGVANTSLIIPDVFGFILPFDGGCGKISKSINVLIDTGSQICTMKSSLFSEHQIQSVLQGLETFGPTRFETVNLVTDESLSDTIHIVIGYGTGGPVGKAPFGFVPVAGSIVKYIDNPTYSDIQSMCRRNFLPVVALDEAALYQRGEWVVHGTVYVGGTDRLKVEMVIKTGSSGVELPEMMYQVYLESLEAKGMEIIPAEGEFDGFLFCTNCYKFPVSHFTDIVFDISNILIDAPVDRYILPHRMGSVIAVRSSGNDKTVAFGSLLSSQVALLFDYPNASLFMCKIQH